MPSDFSSEDSIIKKKWDEFFRVLKSICDFYHYHVKEECIDTGDFDNIGAITYRERILTVSIPNKSISFTHGLAEVVEGLSKIYRPYFQLLDISYK